MGEPFKVFAFTHKDPAAVIDVETGMHPAPQHLGALGREQLPCDEKRDAARLKEFRG